MNIRPINSNMDRTNFGAFVMRSSDYLKSCLTYQDIMDLDSAAEKIQNTKYFDLEARDDGFAIVNKETKEEYTGNLSMREDEGEGKLVDTDLYVEKVDLNDYLTRKDWDEIGAKYRDENGSGPRSIGERYVYYTDLLDRYEQRKREKQVAENAGGQGMSTSQIIHREVVLKKERLKQMMSKYGNPGQ